VQNTAFSTNKTLNLNGRLINLETPVVMGILNVTPDSFFDGGKYVGERAILERAEKMILQGATILDVGGYSSRPGAAEVSLDEEKERVLSAIRFILKQFPETYISIDTFRSEVARAAVGEGACLVNDISGGTLDENMFPTVGKLNVPYVLMHMKGNPQTMTKQTQYENLLLDLTTYFHTKTDALKNAGVKDVIIDPGFGFAKTREQNFELLNSLQEFKIFGKPLMVGLSRKSMVWKTLNCNPSEALNGTTALHSIALLNGADILRVHDVREAVEVVTLMKEVKKASTSVSRKEN
jgi:dihydropteroate synthase